MNVRAIPKALAAAVIVASTSLVAYTEGMIPYTYADPIGIPTQCGGHTGPDVKWGQVFTMDECYAQLSADLRRDVADVNACIHVPLTVPQGVALVDFAHNFGREKLCSSTMARMVNAGAPPERWCYQLPRWNKARVLGQLVVLPGLVKRRALELAICLGDMTAVPA